MSGMHRATRKAGKPESISLLGDDMELQPKMSPDVGDESLPAASKLEAPPRRGMRLNWTTALLGSKVVLVPYRRKHVLKYHEWMTDPFLQEMTASEPLTLEEEYAMQRSWREDDKKCTFIVLDKSVPGAEDAFDTSAMVGDVNMFLNDPDGYSHVAEIEVMVAEASARRRGLGREAVQIMMAYGMDTLGIRRFYCKIKDDNGPSLRMFESLGYRRVAYVRAFREVELEFLVPASSVRTAPTDAIDGNGHEMKNAAAAAAAAERGDGCDGCASGGGGGGVDSGDVDVDHHRLSRSIDDVIEDEDPHRLRGSEEVGEEEWIRRVEAVRSAVSGIREAVYRDDEDEGEEGDRVAARGNV